MKKIIGVIFLIAIITAGCSLFDDGKMPITSSSDKAVKYYRKGCELSDNIRNTEASEFFQQAISEDPKFAMAYLQLAMVQISPSMSFANLELAKANVGHVSEGEKLWIAAIDAGTKGLINIQRDNYEKMLALHPKDVRVVFWVGNFYFTQQQYDLAIQLYKNIVELDEKFAPVYNMLGYSYRRLRNYNESEISFKKYIELIPNDPNPYDSYADLLMKMGRFNESIDNFKKALEIDPYFTASHIGIASNLNFKGEHIKARNGLHKYFETAKNTGDRQNALFAMAISYIDEDNYALAIKTLKKSLDISHENNALLVSAQINTNIGNILLESGNIKEACEYFIESERNVEESDVSESVKIPTLRVCLYNNARCHLYNGDEKTAETLADQFFKETTDAENPAQIRLAHELFGIIAMKQNEYEIALEQLRQSNLQNPYNLYRIAEVYRNLEDFETARGFYQKVVDFHAVNSMNYAFVRNKAKNIISELN